MDYAIVLGVILPMVFFVMGAGRRIMALVYEFLSVMVSWPFM